MVGDHDASASQSIQDEISELSRRLEDAKARLAAVHPASSGLQPNVLFPSSNFEADLSVTASPSLPLSLHPLLLLADSALPLGSFAFSAGLESYLAHTKLNPTTPSAPLAAFSSFLSLSLSSFASTSLPFLLAAHRSPLTLLSLTDTFDATTLCTVTRRASTSQGRALASVWDRSFAPTFTVSAHLLPALEAFTSFTLSLRTPAPAFADGIPLAPHLAPLFGVVALLLGISARDTAYVFVLGHVKAVLSAGVRAGVFGPYVAQRMLASAEVREGIEAVVEREWGRCVEEVGQRVPVLDLWVGRHECLYSRIFNS